jgi:hypothetical protein
MDPRFICVMMYVCQEHLIEGIELKIKRAEPFFPSVSFSLFTIKTQDQNQRWGRALHHASAQPLSAQASWGRGEHVWAPNWLWDTAKCVENQMMWRGSVIAAWWKRRSKLLQFTDPSPCSASNQIEGCAGDVHEAGSYWIIRKRRTHGKLQLAEIIKASKCKKTISPLCPNLNLYINSCQMKEKKGRRLKRRKQTHTFTIQWLRTLTWPIEGPIWKHMSFRSGTLGEALQRSLNNIN